MSEADFLSEMTGAGHPVSVWSNGPGYRYEAHSHSYRKILCCLEGSIVFHTPDGDRLLGPGERLDLTAGTEHGATVGDEGVRCAEAHLSTG